MLPPNTAFFETECIKEVKPSYTQENQRWLIEIPSKISNKLQLEVGMFVSLWIISSSKKNPPHQPLWFRRQVEQIPPTYLVYIPPRLVSENNLADSKKIKVFLSPERLEESGEILNQYLIMKGIRIKYSYTTYGGYLGGGENHLILFGNQFYLSTFNGLKMEEIPYLLGRSLSEKIRSIDLEKEKNAPPTYERCESHGSYFALSVELDAGKSIDITGDRQFSDEFKELIRMIQILAASGTTGLEKYIWERENTVLNRLKKKNL